MSDLKSRLLACAERWAAAHDGAPLSRLGKAVAGDANFFDRIANGGGVNLATLEKFAQFLTAPVNWPSDEIPDQVRDFAHALGVSSDGAAPSAGMADDLSRGDAGAALRPEERAA